MHRRLARLASLTAAGAIVLALAAPAAAADDAMVRVLHASPDAPAVDIYVNGTKVGAPLADLTFGELSAYVALPGGSYAIKVCAVADATVCPIDVPALAIAAGTHYTIAATNNLASIEAQVLVDDPSPTADKAQVRVVHFSADTPAVDVLTQDGAAKVVENLAYPNATGYLTSTRARTTSRSAPPPTTRSARSIRARSTSPPARRTRSSPSARSRARP